MTMAEDDLRLVGGVLPLDDVDSGDIELAGRFAELVDRLQTAVDELSRAAADRGLGRRPSRRPPTRSPPPPTATPGSAPSSTASSATSSPRPRRAATDLSLVEVRALLADRLRGRPTRANFRTGHLTICTLVPMRSVPHRVVCLLGLDDGVFPRRTAPDGDDIIERAPCVGDRDPRSEDRQLLLDALLAATDHLVITYSGRDERTNAVRPPAVPLGELLDVVDATARADERLRPRPGRRPPSAAAVRPAQLRARRLVAGQPWSFDAVALDGARGRRRRSRAEAPFLPRRWRRRRSTWSSSTTSSGSSSTRSRRSCASASGSRSATSTTSPPTPSRRPRRLEQWSVGDRHPRLRLAGVRRGRMRRRRSRHGAASRRARSATGSSTACCRSSTTSTRWPWTRSTPRRPTESVEVDVDLGDGRSLVGTVPGRRRRRGAHRHVLQGRRPSTASPRGSGCSR